MACVGGRIFMLGGELSPGAQADKTELIHVLDTSTYFLFVMFGQTSSLKKQSALNGQNSTPMLLILVRRPPKWCGSRQRVPRSEDNHIGRHLLRRLPMQHMVLLLFKKIPPPPSRFLASKTPV
jgi:hypothetical protein